MKNQFILFAIGLTILLSLGIISSEANYSNGYDNSTNYSNETQVIITDVSIINFFPKENKIGDVQLNIQIQNNKDEKISNVLPSVSGRGFSTYNVVSIDELGAHEKDYAFVNGNFRESGNVTLTIKINKETFYQNITVADVNAQAQEKNNKDLLANTSSQLEILKKDYSDLESAISTKKDEGYDVSKVNLDELKKLLRNVQSDILSENAVQSKVDINIAQDEYSYQKNLLNNAKPISTVNKLKDYAILFSSIAGAIVLFFTLSELLKKKSVNVVTSVNFFRKKKEEEPAKKEKKK